MVESLRCETSVTFQTDWGQEFGGDNTERVRQLSEQFLSPLDGQLTRYPKGRKGYNGRVERSHHSDDEKFYHPLLLAINDCDQFRAYDQRWEYFYNALRPHLGHDMHGRPPLDTLRDLGYTVNPAIAIFPPFLLDDISIYLTMACHPEDGIDLLAYYSAGRLRSSQAPYAFFPHQIMALTSMRSYINYRSAQGPGPWRRSPFRF